MPKYGGKYFIKNGKSVDSVQEQRYNKDSQKRYTRRIKHVDKRIFNEDQSDDEGYQI